jgi:hypothetical protein
VVVLASCRRYIVERMKETLVLLCSLLIHVLVLGVWSHPVPGSIDSGGRSISARLVTERSNQVASADQAASRPGGVVKATGIVVEQTYPLPLD